MCWIWVAGYCDKEHCSLCASFHLRKCKMGENIVSFIIIFITLLPLLNTVTIWMKVIFLKHNFYLNFTRTTKYFKENIWKFSFYTFSLSFPFSKNTPTLRCGVLDEETLLENKYSISFCLTIALIFLFSLCLCDLSLFHRGFHVSIITTWGKEKRRYFVRKIAFHEFILQSVHWRFTYIIVFQWQ